MKNVVGVHLPSHPNRQTLPGELVDNRQQSERLAVMGTIHHKVVGPRVVGMLRAQSNTGTNVEPNPSSLWLAGGDFEALSPPDPLHPLRVDLTPRLPHQRRDPSISVSAVLAGQLHDGQSERILALAGNGCVQLSRAVLTQDPAGTPLRHPKPLAHLLHAALRREGGRSFLRP